MNFEDISSLQKYLSVTKEILIPALKSQTNKDFSWAIIVNRNTVDYLKNNLDFPFIPFYGNTQLHHHLIKNNVNIQTRHDCDDYMADQYVETIQRNYLENKKKYDCFLIQAQPTKVFYPGGKEVSLPKYHNQRCSMFLSICQENVKNHIFERKHGQMYEITQNIITLPEGLTKWMIHGNNRSIIEKN